MFRNIMQHPKTSIAGVLIGLSTAAGVLSQQGITLGHAGTGTVVALVASLATVFLGLLSKDPGVPADSSGSTAKLGALMLCAILLSGSMPVMGCSGQNVAENIVNWTPALESAVQVVSATGSVLDPAAAPVFQAATEGFTVGSAVLVEQAKAYLANPRASTLQQLQTAVVTFQQTVNASLLAAAKIVNPASQQKALADINAVAVIVSTILALVSSISGKAAVARMSRESQIKTAQVFALIDTPQAIRTVATHYDVSRNEARGMVAAAQYQLQTQGL